MYLTALCAVDFAILINFDTAPVPEKNGFIVFAALLILTLCSMDMLCIDLENYSNSLMSISKWH